MEEEIEEDDSYLDLAGMKEQSQMNVRNLIFTCAVALQVKDYVWLLAFEGPRLQSDTKLHVLSLYFEPELDTRQTLVGT